VYFVIPIKSILLANMKILMSILLSLILACHKKTSGSLFKDLIDKENIEIHLKDYGLQTVPKEIGTLKNAKQLYISYDSITGWTSYPPLSALGHENESPFFRRLPDEITTLTKLQTLTLVGLDLVALPDEFGRLENLDTLILYVNKLTISNELGKLSQLKKLRYLGLHGNNVTAKDLEELKKSIPAITTNPGIR